MLKLLSLCFFLLTIQYGSAAQSFLTFSKNWYRQAHYYAGDEISFRVKGDDKKYTDLIRGFEDSLIVFHYHKIPVADITHLYVDYKTIIWFPLRYKYERLFLIGGAGYLGLDLLNTGELDQTTLSISGSLIGAGLLTRWLIRDYFVIDHRNRLKIVNPGM